MYKNVLIAVALLAIVPACRDANRTSQEPEAASAPATSSVANAPAPSVPVVSAIAEPLAGGVQTLPFKYHVAVERNVYVKKTGKTSREVGLEFLEGTVPEVDAQMAAAFEKVGYKRDAAEPQGRALRSLFKKDGSPDVLVWVRPGAPRGERYKLQQPNAKGTVYMAWSVEKQADKQ